MSANNHPNNGTALKNIAKLLKEYINRKPGRNFCESGDVRSLRKMARIIITDNFP